MTVLTPVSTVAEFMSEGQPHIHEIYAYRLEAALYEDGPDEAIDPDDMRTSVSLHYKAINDERLLLLRFVFLLTARHWHGRVDYVAEYELDKNLDVPHEVLAEFAERSGLMCVHPYVRSAVVDLTSKLSVPTVHLPLIRPGELRFTLDVAD